MYYSTHGLEQLIESRMLDANQERNQIRLSRKNNPLGLRAKAKLTFRMKRNKKVR